MACGVISRDNIGFPLERAGMDAGGLGRCVRFSLSGQGQQVPVQGSACQQAVPVKASVH